MVRVAVTPLHPLSERQYDVVQLYGDGYREREIAEKLGLAYKTVKRHMEEARLKLDVHSAGAAVLALRRMLVHAK